MSEIWRPSAARVAAANLTRFIDEVNTRKGLRLSDYSELYAWSVEDPAEFWQELARFAGVRAEWGNGPVIAAAPAAATSDPQSGAADASAQMPGARFFPDTRLNFAENLLRYDDEQPALVFRNERGTRKVITYKELREAVARIAAGL